MTENVTKVLEFFNEKPGMLKTSKVTIAERLNVSPVDIDQAKKLLREQTTPAVNDLEEYSNEQGFDLNNVKDVWYKNKNLSVRVRPPAQEFDKEELYEFLKDYNYEVPESINISFNDSTVLINIFDAHIDKLGINNEGGLKDVQKNVDTLFVKFLELLSLVSLHRPKNCIFPIGNDFFNTNNSMPETKAGTYQPSSCHWQDSFQVGVRFYRTCIDTLITNGYKVILPIIPGNHDEDKTFYLTQVLKAIYGDKIEIIDGKTNYKFVYLDEVLFGFEHGKVASRKVNDLPTVMALTEPQLWAKAKHRVWLLGDKHHKREFKLLNTFEHHGVDIKFLRGTTDPDLWHTNAMWIGSKKSVSAMLYSKGGSRQQHFELTF